MVDTVKVSQQYVEGFNSGLNPAARFSQQYIENFHRSFAPQMKITQNYLENFHTAYQQPDPLTIDESRTQARVSNFYIEVWHSPDMTCSATTVLSPSQAVNIPPQIILFDQSCHGFTSSDNGATWSQFDTPDGTMNDPWSAMAMAVNDGDYTTLGTVDCYPSYSFDPDHIDGQSAFQLTSISTSRLDPLINAVAGDIHTNWIQYYTIAMSGGGKTILIPVAYMDGVVNQYPKISRDGGATWNDVTGLPPTPHIAGGPGDAFPAWLAACFSQGATTMYIQRFRDKIWKSTNSGVSWSPLPNSPIFDPNPGHGGVNGLDGQRTYRMRCSQNGSVIAAMSFWGAFYVSHDGGTTWTFTDFNAKSGQPIHYAQWGDFGMSQDGSTFYVSFCNTFLNGGAFGNGGPNQDTWAYKSTDGGVTWTPLGLSHNNYTVCACNCSADGQSVIFCYQYAPVSAGRATCTVDYSRNGGSTTFAYSFQGEQNTSTVGFFVDAYIAPGLTNVVPFVVPVDWNNDDNSIRCIGGGGGGMGGWGGGVTLMGGSGGGGGAYAEVKNIHLTPGRTIYCQVGKGGASDLELSAHDGGDTIFNVSAPIVLAKGGKAGVTNQLAPPLAPGGKGGQASECIPQANAASGGDGGDSVGSYSPAVFAGGGAGGGGAGGPNGDGAHGGKNVVNTTNNTGGAGGGAADKGQPGVDALADQTKGTLGGAAQDGTPGGQPGIAINQSGAPGSHGSGGGASAAGLGGSSDGSIGPVTTIGGAGGPGANWLLSDGSPPIGPGGGGGGGGARNGSFNGAWGGAGGKYGGGGGGGGGNVAQFYSMGGAGYDGVILITHDVCGNVVIPPDQCPTPFHSHTGI